MTTITEAGETARSPMIPAEATQKLIGQFELVGTFQLAVDRGLSRTEAAAQITSLVATTFTADIKAPGEELAYLTDWHADVRQACSDRYATLAGVGELVDRAQVRSDPHLQLLNGIRQGVHRAMVQRQQSIIRQKR